MDFHPAEDIPADTASDSAEIQFPFTAIVGQERLQLGLILTALVPEIGGVIIRGEKGTAKTTTVRALAPYLNGSLVNLPLGATEDRVVGSIDVESVLTTGKARFEPGLLSAADGGILYIDEINLLPDHLVDAVLDAAATGRVVVERDGISHSQTSRFVLVGTMNPEEGELRPQLLDRFGLAVDVAAPRQPEHRAEIVARRLAFDADPVAFAASYHDANEQLRQRLARARQLLELVALPMSVLHRIAALCAAFDVDGLRADLVIARAARAHAAWRMAAAESSAADSDITHIDILEEDVKIAAEMALPHRRRRDPFDEPGLDQRQLDEALEQTRQLDAADSQSTPESEDSDSPAEDAAQDPPESNAPTAQSQQESDAESPAPQSQPPKSQPPKSKPSQQASEPKGGRAHTGASFRSSQN